MSTYDPTIIVGHLDDKELNKKLESLVENVQTATNLMAGYFDDFTQKAKSSLAELGSVKFDIGKTGGSKKIKETAVAFDKMAESMQRASGKNSSIFETYDIQIKILLEDLKKARRDIENYHQAANSPYVLNKAEYAQLGVKSANEAEDLMRKIQALEKAKADLQRLLAPQGDAFKNYIDGLTRANPELQRLNEEYRKGTSLLQQQAAEEQKITAEITKQTAVKASAIERKSAYGIELTTYGRMPMNTIDQAESKLRKMLDLKNRLRKDPLLDTAKMQLLDNRIQSTINKLREMRGTMKFSQAMGMDESSISAITSKMNALLHSQVRNREEQKKMGEEYARLSARQKTILANNAKLIQSNRTLGNIMTYVRNRIIYAFTIGATVRFFNDIVKIRAEYELLDRSLGILIGNMRRGSEIFNELNRMALKSPFTLIELATGTKQLLAYNFAENEVVDTTRRLADISAALGVPMERLVYNLGQIKAQTVLNARDARDFANAGLAIVPMLAEMYTKQKRFGDEIVTTSKVFDMMKKRMVSYSDVMQVINSITDEGGKFFNFQAKQADTLKVQIANLSLAYNNMLNEMGEQNQGAMTDFVHFLKSLMLNWREVVRVVKTAVVAFGSYKLAVSAISRGGLINNMARGFKLLYLYIMRGSAALKMFKSVAAIGWGGIISLVVSLISYFSVFNDKVEDAVGEVERFGKSGAKVVHDVESLYAALESVSKGSSTYKKVLGELNQILEDFNLEQIKESDGIDDVIKKREANIELIKEEIVQRKYLNDIQAFREQRESDVEKEGKKYEEYLSGAWGVTTTGVTYQAENIQKNATAIRKIVEGIADENIEILSQKTGKDLEAAIVKIIADTKNRLRNNKQLHLTEGEIESALNLRSYFIGVAEAYAKEDKGIKVLKENKKAQEDAANAAAGFGESVKMQQRELEKGAVDATKFRDTIRNIVKEFDKGKTFKFTADFKINIPAWMQKLSTNDLKRYASYFTSLGETMNKQGKESANVGATTYTKQMAYTQGLLYAEAYAQRIANEENNSSEKILEKKTAAIQKYKQASDAYTTALNKEKQHTMEHSVVLGLEEEKRKALNEALKAGATMEELTSKRGRGSGTKKDPLLDALEQEVKLVGDLQKLYSGYTKIGINDTNARNLAAKEYVNTLKMANDELEKRGFKDALTGEQISALSQQQTLEYYKKLLDFAKDKGLKNAIDDIEKAMRSLNQEIIKNKQEKIIESLNSDLSKIKEEYELGVQLDANPELGGLLLDAMGLDSTNFPNTIDEFIQKVQDKFDEASREAGYSQGLDVIKANDDAWKKWAESVNITSEALDKFKKPFEGARDVVQKWVTDTVQKTQELQYKLADTNGKIAIEQRKLAKLEQDLARETREEKKRLLDLQIQGQKETIEKLRGEILQTLPIYQHLFGELAGHSAHTARKLAKQYKDALIWAKSNFDGTYTVTDPLTGKKARTSDRERKMSLERVNKELQKTEPTFSKIARAFKKNNDGVVDYAMGFELLGKEIQNLGGLVGTIGSITKDLGLDEEGQEVINDMAASINGLGQASQGVAQIMNGDVIGGVTNVISGTWSAISTWFDNSDKRITNAIKRSEREVKRLELAYKDLEQEVDKAYGTAEIGAKRTALANKELQLTELKRQLQLEESRKAKNRDEDRIISLRGAIKDLEYEIANGVNDIVNDLLGISSIGDFAESLVSSMIEAFKNGEDYMKVYEESFENMIDNIIMKAIASRVVAQYLDNMFENVRANIDERTRPISEELAAEQRKAQMTDEEIIQAFRWSKNNPFLTVTQEEIDNYRKALEANINSLNERLRAATLYNKDDVQQLIDMATNAKDALFNPLLEGIKEYYTYGQSSDSDKLSALQQGIQGITENTANAIEAYLNGVSQQVYYHSTLLEQIRDALTLQDTDMQAGMQSQMLLQMQDSYRLQQAMYVMMNGWSSSNGQSIKVELIN